MARLVVWWGPVCAALLSVACGSGSNRSSGDDSGADSGAADGPAGDDGSGGADAQGPDAAVCREYVDATAPAGGDGTKANPFRTITAALEASHCVTGYRYIDVAPGTYNAALGETFPLPVRSPIVVEAEDPSSPPVIDGANPTSGGATITLESALSHVKVIDSSGMADVLVEAVGFCGFLASLNAVEVSGGRTAAVSVIRGTTMVITDSVITASKGDGLLVDPAAAYDPMHYANAAAVVVSGTKITGNAGNGVNVTARCVQGMSPCVDLGACPGDMFTGSGNNQIFCNGGYGVNAMGQTDACNDAWNHAPTTTTGSHADTTGPVATTGSTAAAGACP